MSMRVQKAYCLVPHIEKLANAVYAAQEIRERKRALAQCRSTSAESGVAFGGTTFRCTGRARGARATRMECRDPNMGHQHVVDDRTPALRPLEIRAVAGHRHGAPQRDAFAKYGATFLRMPVPGAAWPPRAGAADALAPASRPAAPPPRRSPHAGVASTPAAGLDGHRARGRSGPASRRSPADHAVRVSDSISCAPYAPNLGRSECP